MSGNGMLNVREFGAVGDGSADDTAAMQKAIDAAAESGASVFVPEGVFAAGTLKLRPHTALAGNPTWSYRDFGGSVLRLADENAPCLLDATGALGATIHGLCLDGGKLPAKTHGVMIDKPDYGEEEDTIRIERCRISHFGGDGVHLERIWVFSVRHCMISHNGGAGLWVRGWDGFVLDNWLSGNAGAGYAAELESSSVTMSANRIEWNRLGGIVIRGGSHYNITGNYIDRSGGCGIRLAGREGHPCRHFSMTGNLIYRSGRPDWRALEKHESAHVWFDGGAGLTFTGNTMTVGRDDGGKGHWSPRCGIVCAKLENSVIRSNVLHDGALEEILLDMGGHGPGAIIADNPGGLFTPAKEPAS